MRSYASSSVDAHDVALQLPTGSGKTLVGLLIAEWRRRKYGDKVVYLVPTRQLVNQVVEQAEEKYGLTVIGFTGSSKDYDPTARAAYRSGKHIAVTTYSSVFNTKPFFSDADVMILDDIHAAENYISGVWSTEIERENPEHAALHAALCSVLKPLLEPLIYTRLTGESETAIGGAWVDKLPTPSFVSIIDQVVEVMDANAADASLTFSWRMTRDHINACHLYLSSRAILLRPLIPPTWTHEAFTKPKQRIYMSATLGEGGDMERLVGRAPIQRLPVPEGWDRHGVGRRFFIFPEMSLAPGDASQLKHSLMKESDRSVVLVPNMRLRNKIAAEISATLGHKVFGAEDIQESKAKFTKTKAAAVVMANRYDGVDFPGEECRLLFIEGLPRATNLQEHFLMSRMGANALFNERVQTRVLQAIGRCTRSLEDYSAVVVSGEELPDYLADNKRRKFLHPELQAELTFGIEQSHGVAAKDIVDNLKIFLENGQEWEKVNQQIVNLRKEMTQEPFPAMAELQAAASEEIEYQKRMWQSDYEAALASADRVQACLKGTELRGYRALWHYLAGSAAWLAARSNGKKSLEARARDEFSRSKEAATGITWMVALAQLSGRVSSDKEIADSIVQGQVERLESVLTALGTTYQRQYAAREKEILEGLKSENTAIFEAAHKLLGVMLGFESDNKETSGAPDPWWISSNLCLVFEDHSGASPDGAIDIAKARQAASHPAWMRDNVPAAKNADIVAVLITPAKKVKKEAMGALGDVSLWKLGEFQEWATGALATIRELRTTFGVSGDLVWRAEAMTKLKSKGYDAVSLVNRLRESKAREILKPV